MPCDTSIPFPRIAAASLFLLALPMACAWDGPGALAEYGDRDLQREIRRYYEARATEDFARCPSPRISTLTRAELVEDTPQRVVMDIGYRWRDEGQTADGDSRTPCQGFGERRFTFARAEGGELSVERMSGPRPRR